MSAPEQNAPPAPVSTSARRSRSLLRRECVGELDPQLRVECVFSVGPVQRQRAHAVAVRRQEHFIGRHQYIGPITPSARKDASSAVVNPSSRVPRRCARRGRDGAHRRLVSRDHRWRQQRGDVALRRADPPPPVPGRQLRMYDDLAGQVVPRVADPGVVGRLLDMREIVLRAPGSDGFVQSSRCAHRSALVPNRGSSARSGDR